MFVCLLLWCFLFAPGYSKQFGFCYYLVAEANPTLVIFTVPAAAGFSPTLVHPRLVQPAVKKEHRFPQTAPFGCVGCFLEGGGIRVPCRGRCGSCPPPGCSGGETSWLGRCWSGEGAEGGDGVGDAPWGANGGSGVSPARPPPPQLPPCPCPPRRAQAALSNACWQLLPPAPRGAAAVRADEMRPDGPAILYNGLRRGGGDGGCGERVPHAAWRGDTRSRAGCVALLRFPLCAGGFP